MNIQWKLVRIVMFCEVYKMPKMTDYILNDKNYFDTIKILF